MMSKLNQSQYKSIVRKLIPAFIKAGKTSIQLSGAKLKIFTKEDGTPVSNGDLAVDRILQTAIKKITPSIEIVSEETIKRNKVKKRNTFWLIDPIDGTSGYIKNKDEYTLNASLIVNKIPVLGIIFAPKKRRLFYSYGKGHAYEVKGKKAFKLNCALDTKQTVSALTNSSNPSSSILKILKKHKATSFLNIRSSYKFCLIASGEFDIYAARPRAKEWDIAAGHAIAEHAGAVVRTHNNKKITYGKPRFYNPSLLVKRSNKI
jgi:3'(2'), 5'-bisphosphate nucleotidase